MGGKEFLTCVRRLTHVIAIGYRTNLQVFLLNCPYPRAFSSRTYPRFKSLTTSLHLYFHTVVTMGHGRTV